MKFCQAHWDLLRTKIDEAGLSAFIADGGEAVAKRMVDGGFEPLLGAHNAIMSNALDQFGLALMMPDEEGKDRRPVCVDSELPVRQGRLRL